MEDGGTGLEGLAGYVDGCRAASDDAISLEDSDVEVEVGIGGGVGAEEMGNGGAADAGADYADGGGRFRCDRGRQRGGWKEEEGEEDYVH